MAELTLDQATVILDATLAKGAAMELNSLTVAVIDSGGSLKAFKRQDGPGAALRPQVATGKAFGAVGFAVGGDRREIAVIGDVEAHVGGPAGGQQRGLGE